MSTFALVVQMGALALREKGQPNTAATLERLFSEACEERAELLAALEGILEIGKRDTSNPKYDGYFESARAAIAKARGE